MSNNNNQQHKSKPQSQLPPTSPATKSKISNINIESTLRASLLKHSQQRQNNTTKKVKSAGQLWYEKLPINEQQQVLIGINALLYKGCMNAAKRTFDTVVRQEMANELHNNGGSGSVDQVSFDGWGFVNFSRCALLIFEFCVLYIYFHTLTSLFNTLLLVFYVLG